MESVRPEMTLVLRILIMSICSLLVITPSLSASEAITHSLAKPNCDDVCGKVTVPFPFGIGSRCSADEWFEMECDKSVSPPRLYLKRTNLEVLSISNITDDHGGYLDNSLQVRLPIDFHNCAGKRDRPPVNLTTSPFSFTTEKMVFVAVMNCDVVVSLNSSQTTEIDSSSSNTVVSKTECESSCSINSNFKGTLNTKQSICNGTNCCEIPYPSVHKDYGISFRDKTSTNITRRAAEECKYAFLADEDYWSNFTNHSTSLAAILNTDFLPVTLRWELNYSAFDVHKWNMSNESQTTQYCDNEYPLYCYCNRGFRGNPYVVNGCSEDINECKMYNISCGAGGRCVNTHGSHHCSYKYKFLFIGFGSAIGGLVLLFATWGVCKFVKKRKESKRKKQFFKRNGGLLLQQQMTSDDENVKKTKLFSSDALTKATNNFSIDRVLGRGGQGTVYKGMLEDGRIVAVKKSKVVDEAKLTEFINEVVVLTQINHRNVVQLLGCCLETEVPLLVYEFIPNGTLSQYIHERNGEFSFTWKMRLRIAAEIAGSLSYLHSAASFPVYHRDIKSENILLDEKFRAKVADFGTSRTISIEQTHLTTLVFGTFGYLDPEYFQSSQFTDKSDVYSFGVVLVELLTGQKAICAMRAEEGRNLAMYFTMSMEENRLFDIVDDRVLEDGTNEEILVVACLALRCVNLSGRNRPTMKEVAIELEGLRKSDREPPKPQQNCEEFESDGAELAEHFDDISTSTSAFYSTTSRSSSLQHGFHSFHIEIQN